MNSPLFNPFESLAFQENHCFLTGKELNPAEKHTVSAFPTWLIDRYKLDKPVTMLEGNRMKYNEMLLPASFEVAQSVEKLDQVIRYAFESGYDEVIRLSPLTLFQWMARVFYGVLYQDFIFSIEKYKNSKEKFRPSPLLQQKIRNLLFMLHSLIRPVRFEGFTPWTIKCYRVTISKDILNYKDETHHLNFCFGMNGFGIVACLQDNGEVGGYLQEMLEKIGTSTLHPVQFEELYGWFLYASYLLREMGDYKITSDLPTLVFEQPEDPLPGQPKFRRWDDETFAKVLTNLWKPWGIPMHEIYTLPNSPRSYLINEVTYQFIPFEKINLPY
ncbi:MAG: hypothetical protein LC117_09080 [Bacteroidia bacterium]|nr:hypothetical protein [Bacteroidia bacterium]MCZ2278065.1 hypothetical protein [Bacteroidia bacterium]